MPADLRLLATDLDGTLIGKVNEFPLYTNFRQALQELRRSRGATWVACTGRTRGSFGDFFSPMRAMDIRPDYVIIRHAYIYSLTRFGYVPHVAWNWRIRRLLWQDRRHVKAVMKRWQRLIVSTFFGVRVIRRKHSMLCFQFDADESAENAAELLREEIKPHKHLRLFKYAREVDIRSVPFTKGLALSELSARLGIGRENILAIGNGHNDISMLDGGVAAMTGCPSNSEAEVIEVVNQAGGHVAKARSLTGVMEILNAYRDGAVDSSLPEWWIPPSEGENPNRQRFRHHGNPRKAFVRACLMFSALYATAVVFGSFGLLPGADRLMRPYNALVSLLVSLYERLLTWSLS